jgi:aryl carrier-like protein
MTKLTHEHVRRQIAEIVGVPLAEVTDDANLMDLGLDSMRAMRLAQRWAESGVPVEFSELAEEPTLRHWWSVLSRLLRMTP